MSEGALAYSIPEEQTVKYRIVPSEGSLLNMDLIGQQMSALSELIIAACKADVPDAEWKCLIANIQTDDTGAVEFTALICAKEREAA